MKQNITKEQWDKLSVEKKEKFDEIGDAYELTPSIGQMIEFLGENYKRAILNDRRVKRPEELCDALWEAVKNKLK